MSLSGHVAFVTGASQGIGRACALRLAKEGAVVALAARNQEKLNEVVSQISAAGGQAAEKTAAQAFSSRSTSWSTMPALRAISSSCA